MEKYDDLLDMFSKKTYISFFGSKILLEDDIQSMKEIHQRFVKETVIRKTNKD